MTKEYLSSDSFYLQKPLSSLLPNFLFYFAYFAMMCYTPELSEEALKTLLSKVIDVDRFPLEPVPFRATAFTNLPRSIL